MNDKCPKCGSENIKLSILIVTENIYLCDDCNLYWTSWQQQEIGRLQGMLKRIAEHPHCKSDANCMKNCEGGGFGNSFGHRCAAAIAREGLPK